MRDFFPKGPDIAFLDGMHRAEYLLRDFMNTERFSHERTLILLHDCLPVNARMADGVIAGYPVHDLRVVVMDGKSHSVDSKEVAFIAAGRKATVAAIRAANPILLEPLVDVEVSAPEAAVGDLTGDLAGKRGHVTGTQPRGPGLMAILGQVPLAELEDYQSRLKSLTGGQGAFTMAFSHYAQVPPGTQHALVSRHNSARSDED